ncbi:hypothetical protein CPE01_29740 [Cellulomonas persica]|uniref:Uncharacterized protein n=1 Tax=Cellulomonas persica TaxID=76861 RepID=A0A510V0D9_9CELL|nr:hypothetical protein CPE01_29740 [Cellulomonas persica]
MHDELRVPAVRGRPRGVEPLHHGNPEIRHATPPINSPPAPPTVRRQLPHPAARHRPARPERVDFRSLSERFSTQSAGQARRAAAAKRAAVWRAGVSSSRW